MDQSTQKQGQGQIIDIIYFLLVNLSFLFLSAILWNIIWIKKPIIFIIIHNYQQIYYFNFKYFFIE